MCTRRVAQLAVGYRSLQFGWFMEMVRISRSLARIQLILPVEPMRWWGEKR